MPHPQNHDPATRLRTRAQGRCAQGPAATHVERLAQGIQEPQGRDRNTRFACAYGEEVRLYTRPNVLSFLGRGGVEGLEVLQGLDLFLFVFAARRADDHHEIRDKTED